MTVDLELAIPPQWEEVPKYEDHRGELCPKCGGLGRIRPVFRKFAPWYGREDNTIHLRGTEGLLWTCECGHILHLTRCKDDGEEEERERMASD